MSSRRCNILISGGYGNGNAGDEALMTAMLEQLRKIVQTNNISIFSDDVSYSSRHYSNENFIYSGRFGILDKSMKGILKLNWILKAFTKLIRCDVFLTGGGTILQDQTHPLFIPFWLSKIFFAIILQKKTMMYGIGAGPITTKIGKYGTRYILNKMNYVTLRGHYSYNTLLKIGINKNKMEITADPALSLSCPDDEEINKILKVESSKNVMEKNYKVGFVIRRWYVSHRKSLSEKSWVKDGEKSYNRLICEMAKFADYFAKEKNAKIFFIPMSIKEPNDDRLAAMDVIERMKEKNSAVILRNDYSPNQAKGIIGKMNFIVGMRFHSLVFFSEFLKPMIGIAYGKKTFDFMGELDLNKFVLDVSSFTSEKGIVLAETAIETFADSNVLKKISNNLNKMKKKVLRNAEIVKAILYE